MTKLTDQLNENEYSPAYVGYLNNMEFGNISQISISDLESQLELFESIPEEKFSYRYADGKWTLGELIVHMCDSELVFAYRSVTFARKDDTRIPGFEQDDWVANSEASRLSKKEIIGLFKTTRNHTTAIFKTLSDAQLMNIGNSNGVNMSVRRSGLYHPGSQPSSYRDH